MTLCIRLVMIIMALHATRAGWAQTGEPFPSPEPAPALKSLLAQAYLTDDEKRRIRLDHGLWDEADLNDAAAKAAASLSRGDLDNPALLADVAVVEDRAEALMCRGEPSRALDLLAGRENTRAVRLRVQALLDLGRSSQAAREAEAVARRLTESDTATEVAEAARAMLLLAKVRGPSGEGVVGYQDILNALGRARDQLDRLSWRVYLAEAMLLYEKDKYADVGPALQSVLTLHPRCAEAWALLGRAAVDGFDFPRAESVAARLEELAGGATADAAIIRALVLIRQSEGEAAEGMLAPLLERYPNHRGLRAAYAAAAAARFDFDAANARLRAFDELAPESPDAYLAVGRAMATARQYDQAAAYLRTAAARAPNWSQPAVELGLSELQAGRDDAAREALERAAVLDRYNVRAGNSLTLLRELRLYATHQSEHFIVRCRPGEDELLAREMLPVLERIYMRVTGSAAGGIDHAPTHRTTVELYPNHQWFSVRITGMPALHTIAAATGPVIAMEAPRLGPGHKAGPYDWARVVQHEYVHTVTLSRTNNRLPHWFTEASAVYLEDAPRAYSTVQLLARAWENNELFDLDTINIGFVRPKKPTDRALAYAQGHWMYEYIIDRFGVRAPLDLMDLYAKGVREPAAFQQVLGVSREVFLADFRAWAGLELEAWGMLRTDAHPDIPALMARDGVAKPTPERVAGWLAEQPGNPFVLEAAVAALAEQGPLADDNVDMCRRYAEARPVDPLPHKLLAAYYLAGPGRDPALAIPHLEYLDLREQSSSGYAMELARRYRDLGEHAKALGKVERAIQIAPYDPKLREFAATTAIVAGDWAMAEHNIRALMTLEPDREIHARRLEALQVMRRDQTPK
ncbi:MAG: hypothetical protein HBSAPP03_11550 [Phycisphaerae bacterium]|nr:MAG: hypothetical protein HBSAPP03_11550 [Phycisphaerae bacterium]